MKEKETWKNKLTDKQKWAWVIGLTVGAYALLYYVNKKK